MIVWTQCSRVSVIGDCGARHQSTAYPAAQVQCPRCNNAVGDLLQKTAMTAENVSGQLQLQLDRQAEHGEGKSEARRRP